MAVLCALMCCRRSTITTIDVNAIRSPLGDVVTEIATRNARLRPAITSFWLLARECVCVCAPNGSAAVATSDMPLRRPWFDLHDPTHSGLTPKPHANEVLSAMYAHAWQRVCVCVCATHECEHKCRH